MRSQEQVPDLPYPTQEPTRRDLERAMAGVVYFAKRVTFADPKHAEFHAELNLLLDEWEELKSQDLTPVAPTL